MTTPVDVSHRQLEKLHDDTSALIEAFRGADFDEAGFRCHLICLTARDMGLDELHAVATRLADTLAPWRESRAPRGQILAAALLIEDVSHAMHRAIVGSLGADEGEHDH